MNPTSVGGNEANEHPTSAKPKKPNARRASLSPGSLRDATGEASPFGSPLSELSSLSDPPSPSLNKGKQTSRQTSTAAAVVLFEPEPRIRVVLDTDHYSSSDSTERSDPNDSTYEEPRQRLTGAAGPGPSPKHRSITKSSVGSTVKKLVKAADPHSGICLLTNAPKPTQARQFCHALARRTKADVLTALEWWWQLDYWTLYIDTRYNIFALMANWHLTMDGSDWTLVPHHKLVTSILNWTNTVVAHDHTGYNKNARTPISQAYQDQEQSEFTYYILPLRSEELEEVAIHRYAKDQKAKTVTAHYHPYSTIGPLTSHVHPHFIIFSAGEKLAKMTFGLSEDAIANVIDTLANKASFGHEEDVHTANTNSLVKIMQIYWRWSSTEHVPQPEAGHEWRYHPEEPKSEP
ncbi:hypothetical protein B0H12DRAFT_1223030 [Mycena haematopus]|nr:hypothetical protein B0H12DRAFT_1223030 [Mycena haematopus]